MGMEPREYQILWSLWVIKYEGRQKGPVIKSLINEAIASNNDDKHKTAGFIVTVTVGDNDMEGSEITTNGIDKEKYYNVELEYSQGRVSRVIIK